jgi:hypothetical protein
MVLFDAAGMLCLRFFLLFLDILSDLFPQRASAANQPPKDAGGNKADDKRENIEREIHLKLNRV